MGKEDIISQLNFLYKLKFVKRKNVVNNRFESTAEHIYSSLILAEYFSQKVKNIDINKVYKLLLYHDAPEIIVGDSFILHKSRKDMKSKEEKIVPEFKKLIPKTMREDFHRIIREYHENKTRESKFAHAIDALDPMVQGAFEVKDWERHGFTEEKLRKHKEHLFKDFPELRLFFDQMIKHLRKKKYFL